MFKKIRLYLFYRKTIRKNQLMLYTKHGLKIDWVNRMYKTLTLTDEDLDHIKLYGRAYVGNVLEKDKNRMERTFIGLGIHELIGLMEMEQLNERQIGIALRYKYFDTAKIARRAIWSCIIAAAAVCPYLYTREYVSAAYGLLGGFGIYLLSRIFVAIFKQ